MGPEGPKTGCATWKHSKGVLLGALEVVDVGAAEDTLPSCRSLRFRGWAASEAGIAERIISVAHKDARAAVIGAIFSAVVRRPLDEYWAALGRLRVFVYFPGSGD